MNSERFAAIQNGVILAIKDMTLSNRIYNVIMSYCIEDEIGSVAVTPDITNKESVVHREYLLRIEMGLLLNILQLDELIYLKTLLLSDDLLCKNVRAAVDNVNNGISTE